MNMEERIGKLEVKVDHIQSDVTEVKTDLRALLRSDLETFLTKLRTLGKETRSTIRLQDSEWQTEMRARDIDLRGNMYAIEIGLEKFRWRFWAALAVLLVTQMLTMSAVLTAITRIGGLP